MYLQVIRLGVRSLAVRTVEGTLACVHDHVTLQLPTGRESLPAVGAFKVKRTAAPFNTLQVSYKTRLKQMSSFVFLFPKQKCAGLRLESGLGDPLLDDAIAIFARHPVLRHQMPHLHHARLLLYPALRSTMQCL